MIYRLKLDKQIDDTKLSMVIRYILNDKKIIKIENRVVCISIRLDTPDTTPTGRVRSTYKDFIIHGKTEQDNTILGNMLNKIKVKKDMFGDCLIDCNNIIFIFVEPKDDEWKERSIGELAGKICNVLYKKVINYDIRTNIN